MLNVKLIKRDELFSGLLISGHANMAKFGEDIVCASVSTLGFTLANYLIEALAISDKDLNLCAIENEEASLLNIIIEDRVIYDNQLVQCGFKFFEIGIVSLLDDYSEYVELVYQEV